ncbi:hypothetical protein QBC34DRAFT_327213 [Podospora aff. communis PSN243]|uniref:Zn(2)-C6 fungal-type domain-containing protein n=1 Tax=Podospora aff. communis PSN243 TaxID=3040156 RepID=A0AAV9GKW0_9PEZI|nr:hypothetical protein QBC34DRAFT_327213 [Podospora aff. communis PSN243]
MQPVPLGATANKPARKFKFHTKSRLGCGTCKARKVKCDETHPHCKRCTSTGRKCDGYSDVSRTPTPPSSCPPGSSSALLAPPHLGLFDSAAEKRSFQYFQTNASRLLGGSFHSSFWGREVIQAAIHHPSICHLVVALGAAYETSEAALSAQPSHDPELVEFALQQCNRSIKELTQLATQQNQTQLAGGHRSTESIYCLLTASILFIHFAHIRGHNIEAMQHTRSAIKVLQDFEASYTRADSRRAAFPIPIAQLRAMLLSAYGQLRCIVEDVVLEVKEGKDPLVTDLKPATLFLSVADAHAYVENLFYNTLAFQQDTFRRPPNNPERLRIIVTRHRELCRGLESSRNALDAFIAAKSRPSSKQQPHDEQDEKGIIILQIYHVLLAVWLRIDILQPDRRETAFDLLEADLEEMLLLCERFIASEALAQPSSTRQPFLRCSSGLGCVMPLHTIAVRCRNPQLRRRALKLLSECTRRDGLWDSQITAKIATVTVEVEEMFMSPPSPDYAENPAARENGRVKEVKFELQGDRAALLRFIVAGREEVRKKIEW